MNPKIDYEEIVKLIDLLDERGLSEFELEIEGFKIKMARNSTPPASVHFSAAPEAVPPPPAAEAAEEDDADLHYIVSPMVGTFYRSPDPSSPPYTEIGDSVAKNQTLCIVEAMKLMNEIESDIDGVIEEIYVENGKPIEYGQKLFAIRSV